MVIVAGVMGRKPIAHLSGNAHIYRQQKNQLVWGG